MLNAVQFLNTSPQTFFQDENPTYVRQPLAEDPHYQHFKSSNTIEIHKESKVQLLSGATTCVCLVTLGIGYPHTFKWCCDSMFGHNVTQNRLCAWLGRDCIHDSKGLCFGSKMYVQICVIVVEWLVCGIRTPHAVCELYIHLWYTYICDIHTYSSH